MTKENSKPVWQSKTIWGAGITTLSILAEYWPELMTAVGEVAGPEHADEVMKLMKLIGIILIVLGRITASQQVHVRSNHSKRK